MQNSKEDVVEGIPFFSQIIEVDSERGPTEEEARHWSPRACGIACVKMLVSGVKELQQESFGKTTWELLNEGLAEKAYCDKGWIHAGLLRLLSKYGVSGQCHRNVGADTIAKIISHGNVCIVSVAVGLRGGEKDEDGRTIGKGGHLILFNGVRYQDGKIKSLRCHHPSSHLSWNWENHWASIDEVDRSFSGNLIEINWSSLSKNHAPMRDLTDKIRQVFRRDL